jgi:hypothetical protein
MSCST